MPRPYPLAFAALLLAGLVLAGWLCPARAEEGLALLRVDPPMLDPGRSVTAVPVRGPARAAVAVYVNGKSQGIFHTDAKGRFARPVALEKGENRIAFYAIEAIPDDAIGAADPFDRKDIPEGEWTNFSSGFRDREQNNGIMTAHTAYIENPSLQLSFGPPPGAKGAHILELRLQNTSIYTDARLRIWDTDGTEWPTKAVRFPFRMQEMQTIRFDLAALAGVEPEGRLFRCQFHFPPPHPWRDKQHTWEEGDPVKGIYAPVYIDYAKVYAPPPEALAEGALPFAPKAELTVSSPEPSLAERFEAAAARLETMRKNPPDPLRWATAFENLTQARAAAARHAYDEAGTRLREAEALLRRLAPSDTALTR